MDATPLSEVESRPRRVAIGTFDGVHLGHREVIAGSDTVLTFDPHPTSIVAPAHAPSLLMGLAARVERMTAISVQEVVVIHFDADFARRSARDFIDDVIVGRLRATHVSVGENFRFGAHAQGDAGTLGSDPRFACRVVPLLEVDGEIVSSNQIRAFVLAGEMRRATRFLGQPFEYRGTVVGGDRRGRDLGFPTANLIPDDRFVWPGHGIYAARANGHPAAVSIGVRPTFETGRRELIEVHLIGFEGDLYGQELRVEFIERLRGERRFDSAESLIEQMRVDVERAREVIEAG